MEKIRIKKVLMDGRKEGRKEERKEGRMNEQYDGQRKDRNEYKY